jgi:hypothetical protein
VDAPPDFDRSMETAYGKRKGRERVTANKHRCNVIKVCLSKVTKSGRMYSIYDISEYIQTVDD